jgi:hypothetical protein
VASRVAADPCKARGASEIEERKRARWHRREGNGELAAMKTFTVPAGDLPSAGGLSGEGIVEAPAGGGPAGGKEWNGEEWRPEEVSRGVPRFIKGRGVLGLW